MPKPNPPVQPDPNNPSPWPTPPPASPAIPKPEPRTGPQRDDLINWREELIVRTRRIYRKAADHCADEIIARIEKDYARNS